MSIFDLAFILAFLSSVVTLVVAAITYLRGRRAKSMAILRIFGICAAGYFFCSIAVDWLAPQRVIAMGQPWCFDELCLTAVRVRHAMAGKTDVSRVAFILTSRARDKTQRANGAWIYLVDDQGNLYAPEPDAANVPLDTPLQPGQSIDAERTFNAPADRNMIGLITGHGGPYCGAMSILIIGGGGCLFNKPTMIRIQ